MAEENGIKNLSQNISEQDQILVMIYVAKILDILDNLNVSTLRIAYPYAHDIKHLMIITADDAECKGEQQDDRL